MCQGLETRDITEEAVLGLRPIRSSTSLLISPFYHSKDHIKREIKLNKFKLTQMGQLSSEMVNFEQILQEAWKEH